MGSEYANRMLKLFISCYEGTKMAFLDKMELKWHFKRSEEGFTPV